MAAVSTKRRPVRIRATLILFVAVQTYAIQLPQRLTPWDRAYREATKVPRRSAPARPAQRKESTISRIGRTPNSVVRPAGLDLSAGAGWISSPIADEHTWRDGKTSFRQILYHELGSIGARLPAPILSPIIAAFIRELVRLELSPLELYRVLLGELDVEEVMRLREGGDDAIERSTVGRVLHDMKELVLVVDRQATSLVDRADRNGDNALTVRELAQILGVEKLIDSALGSLGELVVMRSGDVGLGETLRALLVAPVVVGLERVFAAIRRGLRADTQAFVRLDSNDDGRITLDELLALEGMPLPPQVARALSRLVLSDTDTPNLPVVFAIACARRAQQINGMLSRTASTFCEAYGITRVVERLRAIIGIPGPPSGDGDSAAGAASSSGQPSVVLAHEPSSTTRSERRWHKWRWRLRPNPLSSQAGAGQVAFRRDSTEGRL